MTRRQLIWTLGIIVAWVVLKPLVHLFLLMTLCFTGWFLYPKQIGRVSYLTCLSLVAFGHIGFLQGLGILWSHPVRLLVVGCLISEVIVKNDIHLLIASYLVKWFKPSTEFGLSLVLFVSSGFLSMWISNTSAVAMLIPVVLELSSTLNRPVSPMLLSIAYGSTIGGMLTPIGTPANLVAIAYAQRYFDIHLDFAAWFMWTSPFVFLLSLCAVAYFFVVSERGTFQYVNKSMVVEPSQQKIILGLLCCIVLWATQTVWLEVVGQYLNKAYFSEEWIGVAFLWACSKIEFKGEQSFHWTDIRLIPFSSIALVVTGIFMADGLMGYNVVDLLMNSVKDGGSFQNYQILSFFGLSVSMMTEFCSNTAVASLTLPLSSLVVKLSNLDMVRAVLLITLSANSAFMLPTATPPNALVLGTGKLSSRRLMVVGFMLSLCSMAILLFLFG